MPQTAQVTRQQQSRHLAPNHFALAGGGVHIIYETTALAGAAPRLIYRSGGRTKTFVGNDQVKDVSVVGLGTLVTVRLEMTVDSGSTTFSVLIPEVRIDSQAESSTAPVATKSITTHTSLEPSPTVALGQLQTYTVQALHGTASVIKTMLECGDG